ncbi:MAG: aldo/keto reductase [Actinomycetota bacterium]|nr:MAG: aldo/keto reductase [Actinomycetota bacterium]
MEQRRLGPSGLQVSRLALGTMTWGRDTDVHEARAQLRDFADAGGTLVDTADVYAEGASETILGQLLAEDGLRDQLVLATKAGARPGRTRRADASRSHLLAALDGSLARLGVDHVDLWQLHVWDPLTPLEESLAAVDDAVRSGRVRYAGVSNYSGWELARAVTLQQRAGAAPLVTVQSEYSLLARGAEREVVPAAVATGIGLLPWSPLGRGVLSGKYRYGTPADSRAASAGLGPFVAPYLAEPQRRVVDAVCTAADGLGVAAVQVALAWVRDRPAVVAPVVGARSAAQLAVALDSEHLTLPAEIVVALDEVSAPAMGYPDAGARR